MPGLAGSNYALVIHGASVTVVTRDAHRSVLALPQGIAGIFRAAIVVVAIFRSPSHANGIGALVAIGAKVTIVAGLGVVRIDACPRVGVAAIRGTGILIVTFIKQLTWDALASHAVVGKGTCIVIVAWQVVGLMDATDRRIAEIVGTRIIVRDTNQLRSLADSIETLVARCTEVTILASTG